MRRYVATIAIAAAAATVSVGIAWASTPATPRSTAVKPHNVRVEHYYDKGPEAQCATDTCGFASPEPSRFRLAAGARYNVTITMSLQYRTSSKAHFSIGAILDHARHRIQITPRDRSLAPSVFGDSTTETYRVDLVGGKSYSFTPNLSGGSFGASSKITTSKLLLEIDARVAP